MGTERARIVDAIDTLLDDTYEEGKRAGYDEGYSRGYDEGSDRGYTDGYESAKKEE